MKIKRIIALMVVLMLCISVLGACSATNASTRTESSKKAADTKSADGKKLKITVVGYSLGNTFHTTLAKGAEDACKDLGLDFAYTAPQTFDLQKQVGMVEAAVEGGTNAVVVNMMVENAYNKVVEKAHQKGIIVEAYNSDCPESNRDAFVGQDLESWGYEMGKYIFKKMDGKGKYAIFSCGPGQGWSNARVAGLQRAQKEFPNVELINIFDYTTDMTKGVGVVENCYMANPDIKALVSIDSFSEIIGTFVSSRKLEGKIITGGADLTAGTLKHIRSGAMQVTLGQRPYTQGYMAVVNVYQKLVKGKSLIPYLNTGMELVDSSNIDQYINTPE